jgi:hypothetical protein
MLNSKWCLVIGLLAAALFVTTAVARDAEQRGSFQVDPGSGDLGVLLNEGGAVAPGGDIVYGGANTQSGYFYRPFPGYRDYDDIHLELGPRGGLLEYQVRVYGRDVPPLPGSVDTGPYDVTLSLWTSTFGDPAVGEPDTMIGTPCIFPAVPLGASATLVCTVPTPIAIPDGLWIGVEFNQDNCGWLIASGAAHCPNTGPPGYSENFFAELDLIGGPPFMFWLFNNCPGTNQASFARARIVVEGAPWACCAGAPTFACTNIQESDCVGVYTEGTLCNNLPEPCSAAGACCDTATGDCRDTFQSLCDGYLEVFTAGATCATITTCVVPPNVPTLTQWGMIALTALLLTGLTIKFGRRRTVTA